MCWQDALNRPLARQRPKDQRLPLGQDGGGADQAVAGGGRGVGLQPAADGAEGPLPLGRDAWGDGAGGPRQVVEALGPGLEGAARPLVELDGGAADGGANRPDGSAGAA
jgi:hypothetical protein